MTGALVIILILHGYLLVRAFLRLAELEREVKHLAKHELRTVARGLRQSDDR